VAPNLFAPTFQIRINGTRPGIDVDKSVTDLRVVLARDAMDQASLTLANPYPKLRWTHTADADLFSEGSGIEISLGYVGELQKLFDGEITSIAPSFPETGVPVVQINATTRMHHLKQDRRTRTFTDKRDSDVAEQIARDLKLSTDVDATEEQHAYLIQAERTDLDFLLERAQRIHYQLWVDGKTLHFKKAAGDDTSTHTLVWSGGQKGFAPDASTFPLRSFTPTMNTLHQPTEVIVRSQDPKTREAIVAKAGSSDLAAKAGSKSGADVAQSAGRPASHLISVPVASRDEADAIAKAVYNALADTFVTGTGATIGIPGLRAGSIVKLLGLGDRFNGDYFVTEATHAIGAGGYTTGFKVRRNAVG
jgi:Bacteriophage probable baseplate hub protein